LQGTWTPHLTTLAKTTIGQAKSSVVASYDSKRKVVYAVNFGDDSLYVLDPASGSSLHTPIKVGHWPTAISVNPNTGLVYTANLSGGTVSVIDGNDLNAPPKTIHIGQAPGLIAVQIANNTIYVVDHIQRVARLIDGDTNTILPQTFPIGRYPTALVVDQLRQRAYVASGDDNQVTWIDSQGGGRLTVGANPRSLAIDADHLYVAPNDKDYVSSYDIRSAIPSLSMTFKVGLHPNALAVDQMTDQLWITSDFDASVRLTNRQGQVSSPWNSFSASLSGPVIDSIGQPLIMPQQTWLLSTAGNDLLIVTTSTP